MLKVLILLLVIFGSIAELKAMVSKPILHMYQEPDNYELYKALANLHADFVLSEDLNTYFNFKAQLPKQLIKMSLLTNLAVSNLVYNIRRNRLEFQITKELNKELSFSLIDMQDMDENSNKILFNLAYSF